MAEYKLSNRAVDDLSRIWEYTFEVWSEKQADEYYKTLLSACQKIAENRNLGVIYELVGKGLFGLKVKKHIIFYRVYEKNYVEITRILHERMDLKKRLSE